jgi:arginyl-tRNA synthetase
MILDALKSIFRSALQTVSPDLGTVDKWLDQIKAANHAAHGDYQANMAMSLAKALGRKPHDLAASIIEALPANDVIATATVAGPGYINLTISDSYLSRTLSVIRNDDRLGYAAVSDRRTFVIDYSGPNVAKPLHVGHLRSTIIGDALTRILRFQGHRVITDNHLGDWGTQFGMLIYGFRNVLDRTRYEAEPVRELARVYIEVRRLIGADDADDAANSVAEACRAETAKLHAGDEANLALWREFMPHSLVAIAAIYRRLGILPFDYELGESFYNPELEGVVKDLLGKSVAEPGDHGSVIVRPGKDQVKVIRKKDGAFTYFTSDLATIRHRVREFAPDGCLYVVDFRQSEHFKSLFEIARRWGYSDVDLVHVSFGSITGADGKALKTREGTAVELAGVLDDAEAHGVQKYRESYLERTAHGHDVAELTEDQIRAIGSVVGIGAVKYADLCQNRTSDYRYDPAKMLATDGNTATYMQYAYARAHGIFRRGGIAIDTLRASSATIMIVEPAERTLAIQLLRFSEAIDAAMMEFFPHLLTAYLWDLAKAYNQFFEQCPVLAAESEAIRDSRLLLVDRVARTLQITLDLLGIGVAERM